MPPKARNSRRKFIRHQSFAIILRWPSHRRVICEFCYCTSLFMLEADLCAKIKPSANKQKHYHGPNNDVEVAALTLSPCWRKILISNWRHRVERIQHSAQSTQMLMRFHVIGMRSARAPPLSVPFWVHKTIPSRKLRNSFACDRVWLWKALLLNRIGFVFIYELIRVRRGVE